jgi:PncC family amidohydrolase
MRNPVRQIHDLLIKTKKTVSAAESCTGGILSSLLTSQSGSSNYFILGLVVYSDRAKSRILSVSGALIAKEGAVSEKVALAMAESVKKLAKTNFGIGITGIAGPTGGSMKKPVGTVFIAVSGGKKTVCKKFCFKGGRLSVRKHSALKALEMLKEAL